MRFWHRAWAAAAVTGGAEQALSAREQFNIVLAGGLLAFAISFDEVIVTTFTAGQQQTLPIWMLEELVRPRQRPVANVVAMVVVLVTFGDAVSGVQAQS